MTIDQVMGTAKMPTKAELKAALAVTMAVAETIREAKEVPSGHLYAMLVGRVDLQGFQAMIRTLKNAGLVAEQNDMLTWVGPEVK